MDKSIKIRFKMYKAGRRWLVAAAAVAAFSVGTTLANGQGVNAATTDSTSGTTAAETAPTTADAASANTTDNAATSTESVPTNTTAKDTTPTTDETPTAAPAAATTETPTTTPTAAATTATPKVTAKTALAAPASDPAIQQTDGAGVVQPSVDPSNGAITANTGVTVNAWMSAENDDGTTSTTGYNASQGKNQISSTAKNVQVHYEISNTTGSDITNVSAQLYLPPTGQNTPNGAANGPTFTINTSIDDIEAQIHAAGYTSNYSDQGNVIWPGHWYDADHFVATYNLQQLSRIWYSIGTLAAGAKYDVVIDLTMNNVDTSATSPYNVSQFAIQDSTTPGDTPTASYSVYLPTPVPVLPGMGSVTTSIGATGNQATTQYTTAGASDNVKYAQTQVNYSDVNNLNASFTVGNPTSTTISIHPIILLPLFNDNNSKWVLDASKVTEATFEDALPGVTVTYSKDGDDGNYKTYSELMAAFPDFTWDQLQSITIDGPVAAGTYYTVNLPMVYTGTKAELATAGVGTFGSYNYDMSTWSEEDTLSTASLVSYSYGDKDVTSTRTINFVNADGTTAKDPVVQTITYKTVKNDQTGETIYTPQGAYYQYDVPAQAGYSADKTTITQQAVGATDMTPENTEVTVTYTPKMTYGTATSTRTIHFVDADGNVLRDPVTQTIAYKTVTNAVTGETIYTPQNAYYQYDVPAIAGYNVDNNQIAQETVKPGTAVANDTDVTVTYTPKMTYGTANSTRTIHFVDAEGNVLRDPVTQTITYKTVTNAVTGDTIYTPQNAYYQYDVPAIAGYNVDTNQIAQETVKPGTAVADNTDVTVTYTPKMTYGTATSTRTIHFVDAEGNVLRDPVTQTITYKTVTNAVTGDTIYTPQNAYYQYDVPAIAGYNVDTNQVAQATVKPGTAVADDTDVTVTYTPKMTYGTATSTRTIHFVDAAGKELRDPVVQTITYKTVTNAVTGETIYTPQGAYYAYQVPTIAGYHTDSTVIAQLAVGAGTTAPEDIDVAVTYTKDAAVVTPAQPSTKPSVATTTKPAIGSKTTTKAAAQAAAKKLPKTGDEANTSIALLGSALVALVGVAGYRKRA